MQGRCSLPVLIILFSLFSLFSFIGGVEYEKGVKLFKAQVWCFCDRYNNLTSDLSPHSTPYIRGEYKPQGDNTLKVE